MTVSPPWVPSKVLALIVLTLAACSDPADPETLLKETMDTMEAAAESGEGKAFMSHVAEDFSGQSGRLDRDGLGRMLRGQMLRHTRISATIVSREIQMFENRARVDMKLILTGGPRAWMPDTGDVIDVETGWRLTDDGWQMINAAWTR